MEKHITLVGVLNIVYRSLAIIAAIILAAIIPWLENFIDPFIRWGAVRHHEIPAAVMDIIPIILLCVAAIILVVSVIGIIGAIGVLKRKNWGRILLLVVSFLNLIRIPLGTILGIYSIWVLMKDETIRLFDAGTGSQPLN